MSSDCEDNTNLLLKSIYLVSFDSSEQLFKQVRALRWRSSWTFRRSVDEPANEDTKDKNSHAGKEVSMDKIGERFQYNTAKRNRKLFQVS